MKFLTTDFAVALHLIVVEEINVRRVLKHPAQVDKSPLKQAKTDLLSRFRAGLEPASTCFSLVASAPGGLEQGEVELSPHSVTVIQTL